MDIERKGNLVRLLDIDSDFIIDLRYATADNFTGQKVYQSGECWIDDFDSSQKHLSRGWLSRESLGRLQTDSRPKKILGNHAKR